MREILFRGKRIDNGEWVEGFLSKSRRIGRKRNTLQPCIDFEEKGVMISSIILPETVCQYTGLTDRNGKRIFGGDIIAFEDTGGEGYEYIEGFDFTNRAVVVWSNGRFELDRILSGNSGVLEDMNGCHEDFWNDLEGCEVVGNIFDNPELVEVEHEL